MFSFTFKSLVAAVYCHYYLFDGGCFITCRAFIDFFFIFTMHLYCPIGLSKVILNLPCWKLGIPPVLEGVGEQIFFFLICLLLSVNSRWSIQSVDYHTLFRVSEIFGLGTGTRLKSLARQKKIHFCFGSS